MILFLMSCHGLVQPAPEDTQAPPPEQPQIESVTASCSSSLDKRTIEVRTVGWTAGGRVSFTLDGQSIEEHPILSIEADADGAWDRLRLELQVVADPGAVAQGSRSAMLCDDDSTLSTRLAVYTPDSKEEADCRTWGPEQAWQIIGDYPDCPLELDASELGD